MSGLQLRDAHASVRDAIEAVTLSAFQEYAASKSDRWEDYRQGILAALAAVQPATQIVAEQNSEIIGSVLLYPKGTVIAIPGSAPITLSWPAVRLLEELPPQEWFTIKAIVRDLELQGRDWALAGYFLPSSGSLGAVTGLGGRTPGEPTILRLGWNLALP